MKIIPTALLILLTSPALADSYLTVNVASLHYARSTVREYNLNEVNPGLGLEYSQNNCKLAAGQYLNSVRHNSNYIYAGYLPYEYKGIKAGIVLGSVTGYAYKVTPVIGLTATYNLGILGVTVIATPSVSKINALGFLGFQVKYSITK